MGMVELAVLFEEEEEEEEDVRAAAGTAPKVMLCTIRIMI